MKYQPISCNFYDELTLLAMRGKQCPVVFKNEKGEEQQIEGVIKDVFTRKSEEFMLLANGDEIRLDWLVSVDGKVLAGYC